MSDVELVVVEDEQELAAVVGERLARAAREGGNVVLTGGKTPELAYEEAAKREGDWSKLDLWWGDERCVPPDHDESNYGMAKRALLDRLQRAPRGVHRIKGELRKEKAAAEKGFSIQRRLAGLPDDARPQTTAVRAAVFQQLRSWHEGVRLQNPYPFY